MAQAQANCGYIDDMSIGSTEDQGHHIDEVEDMASDTAYHNQLGSGSEGSFEELNIDQNIYIDVLGQGIRMGILAPKAEDDNTQQEQQHGCPVPLNAPPLPLGREYVGLYNQKGTTQSLSIRERVIIGILLSLLSALMIGSPFIAFVFWNSGGEF